MIVVLTGLSRYAKTVAIHSTVDYLTAYCIFLDTPFHVLIILAFQASKFFFLRFKHSRIFEQIFQLMNAMISSCHFIVMFAGTSSCVILWMNLAKKRYSQPLSESVLNQLAWQRSQTPSFIKVVTARFRRKKKMTNLSRFYLFMSFLLTH